MWYQQNKTKYNNHQKLEKEYNMVQSTMQRKCCHKKWKKIPVFFRNHSPPHSKFHKIFNRITLKISYSYMSNMKTIINSHNHKISDTKTITEQRTCNCIDKAKCQLSLNCFIENIIFKAVLTLTNPCYKR